MTMRAAAHALAARGFLIFPIKAGCKSPPLIPAWQKAATSDQKQIVSWWTQWPDANIGIHCDDLCVIDVDPKKGGYERLEKLEQEIQLDATLEVETPSGGRHIYYRSPATAVANRVDALGTGVDIRGKGGYVLAPGSVLHDSEGNIRGSYLVCVEEEICDAPEALVERLRARTVDNTVQSSPRSEFVDTDADAAVERARMFLKTHPVAVEGQGGDHHTFRTICRVRDFGVSQDRAVDALGEWNSRCEPPWDEAGLTAKIENAYSYAQDPAGKLTPEALGFEIIPGAAGVEVGSRSEGVEVASKLSHPADAKLRDVLNTEYLIKGVLEKQSNAVLFGQWNAGKTFVVLDMAASIACGAAWFGCKVRQGRVLYLGYEGLRAMSKRVIALREKYPALQDPTVPFRVGALRHPLITVEGNAELIGYLVEFQRIHGGAPDLVVIDPLANALGGDDGDATMMGLLNQRVAEVMRAQKCTVLRVHHSGHGDKDRARGHSSLPAGLDTEIRVTEQEIVLTKQRDDVRSGYFFDLEVKTLGIDNDGDPVTTCTVIQIEANAMSPELTKPQREYLDALMKLRGKDGLVTATDLKDCCQSDMKGFKQREMVATLERKLYLKAEGTGWRISERGSMEIFD